MLCTKGNKKEKDQKKMTYEESYCERFDISPNVADLPSSDINPKEIREACMRLVEKGANAIILETPEMASVAMKDAEIRGIGKEGVLFATYDKIEGAEFLPQNLFIYTSSDVVKMAEAVIEKCIKEME